MIEYDGIKVKFVVGDAEIQEYMVEKDLAQKKVICWVPSQVGKEFAITITNERQDYCAVQVKADGTVASVRALRRNVPGNVAFCDSESVTRPFVFAKLELVDDDSLLNVAEPHLGEIELACWDFVCSGAVEAKKEMRAFPEKKKVHERSKKGVGQHIGLGKATPSQNRSLNGRWTSLVVTFVFRYRPIDYLQAQGIAPVDPPPPPTCDATADKCGAKQETTTGRRRPEVKVKDEYLEITDDEDDDEIKVLLAKAEQMKAKAEEKRAQKRKKRTTEIPQKKVKKECLLSAVLHGQTIDLT